MQLRFVCLTNATIMKGLRQYIRKHGRHFTIELAMSVTKGKLDVSDIMDKTQNIVYYNVTNSTVGDIVYLANFAKDTGKSFYRTKLNCIKFALCIVGEYALRDGAIFKKWIGDNRYFDFTHYI